MSKFLAAVFCLFMLSTYLLAQAQSIPGPITISEQDARKNLLTQNEPIYPAIAKAVRIEGDVKLSVTIDSTGKVSAVKTISGPAMLMQSAIDGVKKWTFTPFLLNGSPTSASTTLTIPFTIKKDPNGPSKEQEAAAQEFFPLVDQCRAALRARDQKKSLEQCKSALDMSYKAGILTSSDQIARSESLQYYAHALLMNGRAEEALEQINLAIDISVKRYKSTDQELSMPYYWRAIINENLANINDALSDFSKAEEINRAAIIHLPEMKQNYEPILAEILRNHAQLLDQIGNSSEADKLRKEVSSL